MVSPVEAQSLSSLTALFANPPTYPRNPTHEVKERLVLYIFRVPGSRDVFLSPLRAPTEASVSLEAIRSCLYYLHVATSEDDSLRTSLEEQRSSEDAERLSHVVPVQRKPLPPSPFANYPPTERPPLPPKIYPYFQPSSGNLQEDSQAAKFAARGSHLRLNSHVDDGRRLLRRKPIGPRPYQSRQEFDTTFLPSKHGGKPSIEDTQIAGPNHQEQTQTTPSVPPLPERRARAISESSTTQQRHWSARRDGRLRDGEQAPESTSRIVLIRRDPSSGGQWNVGTISLSNTDTFATVQLHTPGYQKFVKTDLDYSDRFTGGQASVVLDSAAFPPAMDASSLHFRRTVDISALGSQRRARAGRQQNPSHELLTSLKETIMSPSQVMARPKAAFVSPWQGVCSFTTGLDGRSLKCCHSLPSNNSAGEGIIENVAEIRFNLPWSRFRTRHAHTQSESDAVKDTRLVTKLSGAEAKATLRRSVQKLKQGSWSRSTTGKSDSTDCIQSHSEAGTLKDDGAEKGARMDLRLGRERAGGGFRGSKAKLGKLIIEDEGLKMCDLVVGACMSIWWQHYSTGREEV